MPDVAFRGGPRGSVNVHAIERRTLVAEWVSRHVDDGVDYREAGLLTQLDGPALQRQSSKGERR